MKQKLPLMGNNATEPDEIVEALGQERILLRFPGAAGHLRPLPHEPESRQSVHYAERPRPKSNLEWGPASDQNR